MLKVSRIVPPRGKHHVDAAGVDAVHGLAQQLTVLAVIHNVVVAEGIGAAPAAQLPGDQGIGSARGNPQVVLQDVPHAVLALDQVDAGNVAVDAARRGDPFALGQIAGGPVDKILRYNAVGQNLLFAVDVFQEQVQGRYPLGKALFQLLPFLGRDDAGNGVKREKPLVKGTVLINAEFDAIARQLMIDLFFMSDQVVHPKVLLNTKTGHRRQKAPVPCFCNLL